MRPGARAELNLSPQLEAYEQEGIKMSQLGFDTGGGKKAIYQPPPDWKYSGGKDSLELLPGNALQAKATVTKWAPNPEISLEEEGRKALTGRMVAMLPEGSEAVKVQAETLSSLQIDGKPTYLVETTYTSYGSKFACYSLLLDRKPEPLFFRLICREADYEKLKEAFQRSLYSWQNL
ncbi:MAG: hypothetical protein ACR2MW_03335 [Chthoniobacterales bacterium]